MSIDIELKTDECDFKYRVSGIIYNKGKVLIVRIDQCDFYCLPGGHVELGEDSQMAILREMQEETGYEVINPQLLAVTENFFLSKKEKRIHELAFYYKLNLEKEFEIDKQIYSVLEHDKDKDVEFEFRWIDIDELDKVKFKPKFIVEKLKSLNTDLSHYISKE